MARYVFRLSVLGPTVLDAARIGAAVNPVFERYGFATEPVTITNVKGIAPPTLRMVDRATGAAAYIANVPPWGEIELEFSEAARAVRTLTQASIVIHGELPPTTASGRAGSAVLSSAVFAAVNAAFGSLGYFNLTGAGREAGLVESGGGGGYIGVLALVGIALWSMRKPGGFRGLERVPPRVEAGRLRKRAQRYRFEGRYVAAKKLERQANRLVR